jgi:hypothetical protein
MTQDCGAEAADPTARGRTGIPGSEGWLVVMNRLVLFGMIGLAGCAAGTPQPRPEDFPLHERYQIFVLDYRIDQHPDRVEAVGLIASRTTPTFRFAVVDLYGVTGEGRVVSRGSDVINGTFGGPQLFSVKLTPTGREVRYQLQVGNYALGRDW